MKRLFSCLMLIALLAIVSASAMAQNSFNYQAIIREGGKVLENKSVNLRLSLMQGDSVYYQELQSVTTNAYGNVSVNVGDGEGLRGSFATIPWESMGVMLQVEVSTDGTSFTNLGAMQIQPVPYAFYAARTTVIQPSEATNDPIFQVKDNDGNLLFAVYETGVKVYVDKDDSGKAAKSKFAVAGRTSSKGELPMLTINADGSTVYVDDNADKAAKSRFAVAGRSAKGNAELLTIDGSGSTIYVDGEGKGKAAKSRFAVAGSSAKKSKAGKLTMDGDGETVYVDFGTKSASADVLTIDGDQATFFIDIDSDGKAAKSRFAVAGKSTSKGEQLEFVVDQFGSVIYIDDIDDSKAAKSRFAVAGYSADKGNNNFFTINRDSTRIYINDAPVTVDTAGTEPGSTPVVMPSLASTFAIVGMTQKTDLLVVNKDSATIKVDTYVAEEVQSTTGVVEKVVDDKVAGKVYSTGTIEPYFSGNNFTINIFYTYYHSELGEYLYLKYFDDDWESNSVRYEYRNYWLVDGKIYRDTTYLASGPDNENMSRPAPIYEFNNDWKESYVLEQEWNGKGILTVLESEMRKAGYKLKFIDSTDYYYDYDTEDWQVMVSKRNTVTALSKPGLLLNNMSVLTSLIEPASVFIHGNDTVTFDEGQLYGVNWESNYTLFDDNVNSDKIAAGNENTGTEHNNEYRKQNLNEIETMLAALKKGFTVTAKPNNSKYGSVTVSQKKERYAYGNIITLKAEPKPNTGYIFTNWSDGCTDAERTICVMSDTTYKAEFHKPILYVSGNSEISDEFDSGFDAEKPLPSFGSAISKIKEFKQSGIDWTISIMDTVKGSTNYIYSSNGDDDLNAKINSLTIEGYGGDMKTDANTPGGTLALEEGAVGSVLHISITKPVIIRNLSITGGNANGGGGIYIDSANVTLDRGTFVGDTTTRTTANSNSYSNKAKNGGGVYVDGGILTIKNGSVIGHNYATANEVSTSNEGGGGVFVAGNGILNIESGAKIVYNGSGKRAGGVLLADSANVTMTGGEISHNETGYFGGGVLFASSGANGLSFNMSGGTISNNKVLEYSDGQATAGGGVFVDCGTFTMSGTASITDNESTINGGGIRGVSNAIINMLGGTVTGNTLSKTSQGLGISLAKNAQLNIGGSAYVDTNNDVYLAIDETNNNEIRSKIVVVSALTHNGIAATITPGKYEGTPKVLEAADNVTLSDWVDKFAITPEVKYIDECYIDADGYIRKFEKTIVNEQSESTIIADAMKGNQRLVIAKFESDFSLTPCDKDYIVKVPVGKTLVITADSPVTLTVSEHSGNFFNVSGTLVIGPNVTISGYSYKFSWHAIEIERGGKAILNGGTITQFYCYASTREAVCIDRNGTFVMESGFIMDNSSGVRIYENGTFIMNGGEITNNKNDNTGGGGVTVLENGTFIKVGGIVKNNTFTSSYEGAAQMYIYAGGKYGTSEDNLTSWPEDKEFEEEF